MKLQVVYSKASIMIEDLLPTAQPKCMEILVPGDEVEAKQSERAMCCKLCCKLPLPFWNLADLALPGDG